MDVTQSFCAVKSKITEQQELTELDRLIEAAFDRGNLPEVERLLDRRHPSRLPTPEEIAVQRVTSDEWDAAAAWVESYGEDRNQRQPEITKAATETAARFSGRSLGSVFEESTRKGAAEATLALNGSDRFGEIGDP